MNIIILFYILATTMEEGQEILDKRYKVIKRLGGGAFGEIYKVEKKKTGDFLAAKVEKAVKN